jgi:hypothetical protein
MYQCPKSQRPRRLDDSAVAPQPLLDATAELQATAEAEAAMEAAAAAAVGRASSRARDVAEEPAPQAEKLRVVARKQRAARPKQAPREGLALLNPDGRPRFFHRRALLFVSVTPTRSHTRPQPAHPHSHPHLRPHTLSDLCGHD